MPKVPHPNVVASAHAGWALIATMGWDRLILALACIIAVTTLTLAGKIDTTVFVAVVGPVVGYVVGAGHEASKADGGDG